MTGVEDDGCGCSFGCISTVVVVVVVVSTGAGVVSCTGACCSPSLCNSISRITFLRGIFAKRLI